MYSKQLFLQILNNWALKQDASSLKTSKIHFTCCFLTLDLQKLKNYFPQKYLLFLTIGFFSPLDEETLRTHVEMES